MTCPHCRRPTQGKMPCTDCQPFNIYPEPGVIEFLGSQEELRLLILAQAEEIRKIGCDQLHLPFMPKDWPDNVNTLIVPFPNNGKELCILPCIDPAGYESVKVAFEPRWDRAFMPSNN